VANVIAGAKEQIAEEKHKMIKDVKAEVSNLVIEATKKVLEKIVNKEIDEKIIKESLKDKDILN
jgi:F0F1-type ATP synthase membrane subunit b/b'